MARRSYLKVLGVVENMTEFVAPDGTRHAIFGSGGGKRLAALTGAPLVGSVPIEPAVSSDGDAGSPVVLAHPDSAAAAELQRHRGADRHRAPAPGRDGRLHGPHVRARAKVGVSPKSPKDPFEPSRRDAARRRRSPRRLGPTSARRAGSALQPAPVPQSPVRVLGTAVGLDRVSLAVQDAVFAAGVVRTVERTAPARRRRPAIASRAAVVRRRVLGEPDASLDDVDAAWRRGGRPHRATRVASCSRNSSVRGGLAGKLGAVSDTEREQRLVFGEIAEQYDTYRPSYPDALFDTIVEFGDLHAGDRALEIGAGTGKATAGFVRRGLDVHALEPSPGMAAVLRAKGVDAEETLFEHWNPAPAGGFRLVYAAQAWHWVHGDDRYERVAAALQPGGTVARSSGTRAASGPARSATTTTAQYAKYAPDLVGGNHWNLEWVREGIDSCAGLGTGDEAHRHLDPVVHARRVGATPRHALRPPDPARGAAHPACTRPSATRSIATVAASRSSTTSRSTSVGESRARPRAGSASAGRRGRGRREQRADERAEHEAADRAERDTEREGGTERVGERDRPHADTSARTVPISTPSTATNADSRRTRRAPPSPGSRHARSTPTCRRRSRTARTMITPMPGDADDEAEREVGAHQQEELLLLRRRALHDAADRVRLAAVGEEATGERVGELLRVGDVERRRGSGPRRHRTSARPRPGRSGCRCRRRRGCRLRRR